MAETYWANVTNQEAYGLVTETLHWLYVNRGNMASLDEGGVQAIASMLPGYAGMAPGIDGFPPFNDILAKADAYARKMGLPLQQAIPVPPSTFDMHPGPPRIWPPGRKVPFPNFGPNQWDIAAFKLLQTSAPTVIPAFFWQLPKANQFGIWQAMNKAIQAKDIAPRTPPQGKSVSQGVQEPHSSQIIDPSVFADPNIRNGSWGMVPAKPDDALFNPWPLTPVLQSPISDENFYIS